MYDAIRAFATLLQNPLRCSVMQLYEEYVGKVLFGQAKQLPNG